MSEYLVPTLERGNEKREKNYFMTIYPVEQMQLQQLLEQAIHEGEIHLKTVNGQLFSLKPIQEKTSPLAISSLNLNWSSQEIVDVIREIRE
jgi:hypothetical protein